MPMSISGGHINPAVTTGLWIADKIGGKLALQYVGAQLLGALVGAALVKGVLPRGAVSLVLGGTRSEEHTSELQSQSNLVCRLLLEKKKKRSYVPGEIRSLQ